MTPMRQPTLLSFMEIPSFDEGCTRRAMKPFVIRTEIVSRFLFRQLSSLLLLAFLIGGCGDYQEEKSIGGVLVPIPQGMSESPEHILQFAFPGFEAGRAVYQGSIDPNEMVKFYQDQMPTRGWKPNAALVARSGVLAYTKGNRGVLITIIPTENATSLTIVVGTIGDNASDNGGKLP